MILIDGPNKKPYAVITGDGRVELDATNPNALAILEERYPGLAAVYKRQQQVDALLREIEPATDSAAVLAEQLKRKN